MDIVILLLVYNELEKTKQTVEQLRSLDENVEFSVIIVDNGSTDGTKEWALAQSDLSYAGTDSGMELWGNVLTQVFEMFDIQTDVVIMQSGYILFSGALTNLHNCLHSDARIGMVGTVLSYSDNVVQRAEKEIANIDDAVKYAESIKYDKDIEVMGLECGLFMISSEALRNIGGFERRINSLHVMSVGFCVRFIQSGYRLKLCRSAFAYVEPHLFPEPVMSYLYNEEDQAIMEKQLGIHYFTIYPKRGMTDLIKRSANEEFSVLEIGCDCGATLLDIKNRFSNCKTYGCDITSSAIEVAQSYVDMAFVANVEEESFPIEPESLDYIIFADVLEHLHDPAKTLRYAGRLLKKGGRVLASIPNLMHVSVFKQLLQGNFTYTETGLLDKTHLHLFTYNEILKIFSENGYNLEFCGDVRTFLQKDEEELVDRLMEISDGAERFMYTAFQYQVSAVKR